MLIYAQFFYLTCNSVGNITHQLVLYMPFIKLSIVFLNFNRLHETQLTCQHLQQLCATRPEFEIIAVDNGSSDGTAVFLQQQRAIKSLLLPDNTGIAGYEAGFEAAQGEYILVLDDDSCPQDLTGIDTALQRMDADPQIGITACHIENPDGTQQWSWHLPQQCTLMASPFFIGCGFLIRTHLFKQIGWYPADFFLYQNEIDVSFKVRQLGYNIVYDPACLIVHRGKPQHRPGWRRIFYPTRNTLWLIRRYYPQPMATYMLISRLLIGFARACHFGELRSFFQGAKAGLCQTITPTPLTPALQAEFTPFWKQNSIIHQLLKRT